MHIEKDTVVSLTFQLADTSGNTLEDCTDPVSYLHGGYGGIFPLVEQMLEGKSRGDSISLTLQPEDAFGEYDATLVHMEPLEHFPVEVEVGMQFEGSSDESGE